jgi:hypothetical protein
VKRCHSRRPGLLPIGERRSCADFNGDGLLDIAVGCTSSEDLLIFTRDGTGKYQLTSYATGVGSIDMVALTSAKTESQTSQR